VTLAGVALGWAMGLGLGRVLDSVFVEVVAFDPADVHGGARPDRGRMPGGGVDTGASRDDDRADDRARSE
jgi:hypothetical protein